MARFFQLSMPGRNVLRFGNHGLSEVRPENDPAAKFCPECGTALTARAGQPASAERKVVTVLFADLLGCTGRAERLDPEDVQAVPASYHECLRYELKRWGGTVEKSCARVLSIGWSDAVRAGG